MVLNKLGNAHFRETMFQANTVGGMASAGLGLGALRADLGWALLQMEGVYVLESLVGLRAGLGRVPQGKDGM